MKWDNGPDHDGAIIDGSGRGLQDAASATSLDWTLRGGSPDLPRTNATRTRSQHFKLRDTEATLARAVFTTRLILPSQASTRRSFLGVAGFRVSRGSFLGSRRHLLEFLLEQRHCCLGNISRIIVSVSRNGSSAYEWNPP